jgi:hypothetical protein
MSMNKVRQLVNALDALSDDVKDISTHWMLDAINYASMFTKTCFQWLMMSRWISCLLVSSDNVKKTDTNS